DYYCLIWHSNAWVF
nr:immunoglobulin light chain junction region [Macaca mulatta]MOX80869.1 immunoglobulin light chain junction region [Macaca mulatta]MOX82152.1 immunoglobulin light chain junction region [Macaca mulatta]